eukprot:scaffold16107_cov67-Phaeocystis_antarctica.AAC.12
MIGDASGARRPRAIVWLPNSCRPRPAPLLANSCWRRATATGAALDAAAGPRRRRMCRLVFVPLVARPRQDG